MIKNILTVLLLVALIGCGGDNPTDGGNNGGAVNLGSADGFAVLAGSTVTSTGATKISGDEVLKVYG